MAQADTRADEERPVGEDRIRIRAYELYEKRGDAPGDPESDWYRAEQELTTERVEEKG